MRLGIQTPSEDGCFNWNNRFQISQLTRDLRLKLIHQILQSLSLSCKQLILIENGEIKAGQEAGFNPGLTEKSCILVKPVHQQCASKSEPIFWSNIFYWKKRNDMSEQQDFWWVMSSCFTTCFLTSNMDCLVYILSLCTFFPYSFDGILPLHKAYNQPGNPKILSIDKLTLEVGQIWAHTFFWTKHLFFQV